MKNKKSKRWYSRVSAGGCQGLVIDEMDGRTVAISYDPANAALLAAAPDLLDRLELVQDALEEYMGADGRRENLGFIRKTAAIIAKAKGE